MRTKLTDISSIPAALADLTQEEKLDLVGACKACHTLAIPDMDIPALCLMDGATGVNGTQVVLDYITAPGFTPQAENAGRMAWASGELTELNRADLAAARETYGDNPDMLGLTDYIESFRPEGRDYISFPSGVNIGAGFNPDMAEETGRAVGEEMRGAGIDVCLGPNVDIARDPLGGRNYEMYGEDPLHVGLTAAAFIRGLQSAGTAACAKHFIANNQETGRNTKDTHVSERTLMEIYSKGFWYAVKKAGVKTIMSAYNAVNGKFTSYNKDLLTGLLRDKWGFEGVVLSDWGAVTSGKEDSLNAGMDLILCGPNDMSGCATALADGRLTMETLDTHVARILSLIVDLREQRQSITPEYDQGALLRRAYDTVVDGAVLLKNAGDVLPLRDDAKVTFYGHRSRDMLEFGSGSTAVITNLHGNVFDEYAKLRNGAAYENMDGQDVLIYTVAAPAGENVDRDCMDIEEADRRRLPEILKEAREKGLKTVVLLNVSGPVDMRGWIDHADAVLCIFIPGCMGGRAAAALLTGEAAPAGKLPVSFPLRYEDTPSYPNFPGEHNDVYYGEGLFVGYRSYEKRKLAVQYPFGFGLSYTRFEASADTEAIVFDTLASDKITVPVTVKNVGGRTGSEVIQVYGAELKPRALRPEKELLGYQKVCLNPGEEKTVLVNISRDSLHCYDAKQRKWVLPVGAYRLCIGTSSTDIFAELELDVRGKNPYPLSGESTIGEILAVPAAVELVNQFTGGMFDMVSKEQINFMIDRKLHDILAVGMVQAIPDAVKLDTVLQALYEQLGRL